MALANHSLFANSEYADVRDSGHPGVRTGSAAAQSFNIHDPFIDPSHRRRVRPLARRLSGVIIVIISGGIMMNDGSARTIYPSGKAG